MLIQSLKCLPTLEVADRLRWAKEHSEELTVGRQHCGMLGEYPLPTSSGQETVKATGLVRTNLLCHSPSLH